MTDSPLTSLPRQWLTIGGKFLNNQLASGWSWSDFMNQLIITKYTIGIHHLSTRRLTNTVSEHINQDYLQFKPSNLNLNLFHYYVIVHKQPLWISWKCGVLDFPTKMKWQIVYSKFFQTESWDTCPLRGQLLNFIENENLKENNLYTHWQKKKCISLPGPEDLSETDLGLNPPTSMLYEPGPRRRF